MSVVPRSPLVCVAFGRVADVADDGAKHRVELCCELDRLREEGVPEAKVRAFVLDHRSEFGLILCWKPWSSSVTDSAQ